MVPEIYLGLQREKSEQRREEGWKEEEGAPMIEKTLSLIFSLSFQVQNWYSI